MNLSFAIITQSLNKEWGEGWTVLVAASIEPGNSLLMTMNKVSSELLALKRNF